MCIRLLSTEFPLFFNTVGDVEIDAISPPHAVGAADVIVYAKQTDTSGTLVEDDSNSLPFTYVAIGFVQMKANSAPAGTTISVTLTNTAAGNLPIAAVSYQGAGPITVTDNLGNTFTSVGKHIWFQGQAEMFYLPNIPGGNVTIKATGATAPWNICVSEYSGEVALYGFNGNSSPSAGTAGVEVISGVAVTPMAGDIVYAVVFAAQPTNLAPDPAFVSHTSSADMAVLAEDAMNAVTAGQTIATDDTTGLSFVPWVVLAAAIQA